MLSWICPDCGCDCAPTDQECPDCSDLVQAGMVALARAIQEQRESFPQPPEIPLQDLAPAPRHRIDARPPAAASPRHVEPQPEPIASPAPILPAALGVVAPQLPAVVPPPQPPAPVKSRSRVSVPGWLISLFVATALSLGGAALIRNMEHKAEAASAGRTPGATPDTSDRRVEVTALRVLSGSQSAPQLQYIVVNHSGQQLSNLKLRIAVRSTATEVSDQPLFTISTEIAGLAPFSSREMTSEIQKVRAADLPDWDRLRAEVQVQ